MTKAKIQKEVRIDKLEDWGLKRIAIVILKTCSPNRFSEFIFVVRNDWYDAWEAYFAWHKPLILSFTYNFSSFMANKDE